MAVPKRRVSKARRDKRRSNVWKMDAAALVKCPKCGEFLEIAQGKRGKYLKCSNKECDHISFFKKKKS